MNNITKQFEKMGARAKVRETLPTRWNRRPELLERSVRLDIQHDKNGPFFDIAVGSKVDMSVLDIQASDRHLLVMAEVPGERTHDPSIKSKFLCGHDERDWFVAAVPESAGASSVITAFEALKPQSVREEEEKTHVKKKNRNRRKNDAWRRQGEWFFIPKPDLEFDKMIILSKEPLRRGRGKPHMVDELVRKGGQTVYVSFQHPNGLPQAAYNKLTPEQQKKQGPFRVMSRDPETYVRGKVRHADHKTIELPCWHLVQMNTESASRAMANVAFLD